jgi:hypothetical protein
MDHLVWSDGCASQFKSSKASYFVVSYPFLTECGVLFNGCQLVWNVFATRHGKGEVDEEGALLK